MRRWSIVGLIALGPVVLTSTAAIAELGPFADKPVASKAATSTSDGSSAGRSVAANTSGGTAPDGTTDRPSRDNRSAEGVTLQDVETRTVLANRLTSDARAYQVLRLDGLRLRGGEPRLLYGSLSAKSRYAMLQQTWLSCSTGTPTTSDTDRSVLSSRNHEGAENGVTGQRSVSVLWLFTPRTTGTYNCALWANGGHVDRSPKKWLDVVQGSGTVLRLQGHPEPGAAEWRQPTDVHLRLDDPKTTAREDISHEVLVKRWTASPQAHSIDVFAGPQASSDSGGHDPFVLDTTIVVSQLDAGGHRCAPYARKTNRVSIPGLLHHLKINARLDNIPIHTGGGCTRTFDIKVVAQYVKTLTSGTPNRPGHIHGKIPSPPDRYYSSAIAMNN